MHKGNDQNGKISGSKRSRFAISEKLAGLIYASTTSNLYAYIFKMIKLFVFNKILSQAI